MLEHGGKLRQAARNYGIPLERWLDLSTGINPNGWPVPPVPATVWNRLPEADDGLEAAARHYYGTPHLLPVAGSQAAIQALPILRSPGRVGVIHPGYAEHAHAWRRADHQVVPLTPEAVEAAVDTLDVLVLIHPNNPTGHRFTSERLLAWHRRLTARGGWLVVDEAFMDATPKDSLIPHLRPGLIVLRSVGKFFGLAGARVGFVAAEPDLLARLADHLGPWTVTGPSRWVVTQALQDQSWQVKTRRRLHHEAARLTDLLSEHGLAPAGGCALFQWVRTPQAATIQDALARQAIWVRRFDDPPSLRFGLPGDETGWQRLARALGALMHRGGHRPITVPCARPPSTVWPTPWRNS